MGVRAVKSHTEGAVDIPVKDLLALTQNPEHFDAMLKKLSQRIADANAAESAAAMARADAEKAKASIDIATKAAEEALERVRSNHEQEMAEARASITRTNANLEARLNDIVTRQAILEDKERDFIHRSSALKGQECDMASRKAEVVEAAVKNVDNAARLTALSEALAAREKSLLDREDKFAGRLRDLNAGL